MSTEAKQIQTIGTHSGTFHCDEAMAIALLQFIPRFQQAQLYRSRDQDFLNTLDVLVDVGSIYDHDNLRYDHHQREFKDTFSSKYSIRLSSAGLIYKHYGLEVLKLLITDSSSALYTDVPQALIKSTQDIFASKPDNYGLIFQRIYSRFVLGLDGEDNGVPCYPSDIIPAYKTTGNLGSRVGRLNPSWTAELHYTAEQKAAIQQSQRDHLEGMESFHKAIGLCREEFLYTVQDAVMNWLAGRSIVENAVKSRLDAHKSGRIVQLASFCPWKGHFFDLLKEDQTGELNTVLFFVYPSGSSWRYLAVPDTESSFTIRVKAPDAWKGLRDAQLEEASGISGLTPAFIHHTFFTGGAATQEGLFQLLEKALEHHDQQQ